MRRSRVGCSGRVCSEVPADRSAFWRSPHPAAVFHRPCPAAIQPDADEGSAVPAAHQTGYAPPELASSRIPTARMPEHGLRDSEDNITPLCGHCTLWRGSGWPPRQGILGKRC